MNEQTVTKIISTLEQSGSETVALYAERAVTDGILNILEGSVLALALVIYSSVIYYLAKNGKLEKEDRVSVYVIFVVFLFFFGTLSISLMVSGVLNIMHPEAEAIEQLITQIRGD